MSSALRKDQKIKNLKSQLVVVEESIKSLEKDIKSKQEDLNKKLDIFKSLKNEISKHFDTTEIKLTEHAVLRYLERVKGYDMNTIKDEIVTEYLKDLITKMGGSGKYINAVDSNYKIVMKNNVIVTIED